MNQGKSVHSISSRKSGDDGKKNEAFLVIVDSEKNSIQFVDVLSIWKKECIVPNNKYVKIRENSEINVFEITCAKEDEDLLSLSASGHARENESTCSEGNVNLKSTQKRNKKKRVRHSESPSGEFMFHEQLSQSYSKDSGNLPVMADEIVRRSTKKRKAERCLMNPDRYPRETLSSNNTEKRSRTENEQTTAVDLDFCIELENNVDDSLSTGNAFTEKEFPASELSNFVVSDNEDSSHTQCSFKQNQMHSKSSFPAGQSCFSKSHNNDMERVHPKSISFRRKKKSRRNASQNCDIAHSAPSNKHPNQCDQITMPHKKYNPYSKKISLSTEGPKQQYITERAIKYNKTKSKELTSEYQLPNFFRDRSMERNSNMCLLEENNLDAAETPDAISKREMEASLPSIDWDYGSNSVKFVSMDQINSNNEDIDLCSSTEDEELMLGSSLDDIQSDLSIYSQRRVMSAQKFLQSSKTSNRQESSEASSDENEIISIPNIHGNNNIARGNLLKCSASKQKQNEPEIYFSQAAKKQLKESSVNAIRTCNVFSKEISRCTARTATIDSSEESLLVDVSKRHCNDPVQNYRNRRVDGHPISNIGDMDENISFKTNGSGLDNEEEELSVLYSSLVDDDWSDVECLEMQGSATKKSCENETNDLNVIYISDDEDEDCDASKWYYMPNLYSKSNPKNFKTMKSFLSQLDFTENPVDFQIPTLHESELLQNINLETRKELLKIGIETHLGRWRFTEVETLKRNWNNFMNQNNVKNQVVFYSAVFHRQKYGNMQLFLKRKHFLVRLAQDINKRTLLDVYKKASLLLHPKRRSGKMTRKEIEKLKQYQKQYGNKWTLISELMGKHAAQCRSTYLQHIEGNHCSGSWSEKEMSRLNEAVSHIVGPENLTRLTHIRDLPWTAISKHVGTRSACQCFIKALGTIGCIKRQKWRPVNNACLIFVLYRNLVEDETLIDWHSLYPAFQRYLPTLQLLKRYWSVTKQRYCPHWRTKTHPQVISYLFHNYLPGLLVKTQLSYNDLLTLVNEDVTVVDPSNSVEI